MDGAVMRGWLAASFIILSLSGCIDAPDEPAAGTPMSATEERLTMAAADAVPDFGGSWTACERGPDYVGWQDGARMVPARSPTYFCPTSWDDALAHSEALAAACISDPECIMTEDGALSKTFQRHVCPVMWALTASQPEKYYCHTWEDYEGYGNVYNREAGPLRICVSPETKTNIRIAQDLDGDDVCSRYESIIFYEFDVRNGQEFCWTVDPSTGTIVVGYNWEPKPGCKDDRPVIEFRNLTAMKRGDSHEDASCYEHAPRSDENGDGIPDCRITTHYWQDGCKGVQTVNAGSRFRHFVGFGAAEGEPLPLHPEPGRCQIFTYSHWIVPGINDQLVPGDKPCFALEFEGPARGRAGVSISETNKTWCEPEELERGTVWTPWIGYRV